MICEREDCSDTQSGMQGKTRAVPTHYLPEYRVQASDHSDDGGIV